MSVTERLPSRPPRGLGAPGRAFWRQIALVFALSASERALLVEVCRTLDNVAALQAAVDRDGPTVPMQTGMRVHPALTEIRQQQLALGKLLVLLALPDEDGSTMESARTRKARKAAESRWRTHNERKAADGG